MPEDQTVYLSQPPGYVAEGKEEPNKDMTCLKTRPIPQKDWLEQLDKEFGQGWFNGAWSIKDKQYTVTQKGNALQVWKVAVAEFLFLGTDSIFCLGVKTKLIPEM